MYNGQWTYYYNSVYYLVKKFQNENESPTFLVCVDSSLESTESKIWKFREIKTDYLGILYADNLIARIRTDVSKCFSEGT